MALYTTRNGTSRILTLSQSSAILGMISIMGIILAAELFHTDEGPCMAPKRKCLRQEGILGNQDLYCFLRMATVPSPPADPVLRGQLCVMRRRG